MSTKALHISPTMMNPYHKAMLNQLTITLLLILCITNTPKANAQQPSDYFAIQVVDKATGRGVPLVALSTVNSIVYYTDNNGIIAFYEPGLMDQDVYFYIKSHGYEYPADGFGNRGVTLKVTKGGSALIEIERINIAERLYRITGQGLYHHSVLMGRPIPIKYPVLNGKVLGQDTYVETLYKGKIYWLWGDTQTPAYPLGNFATSGATSELPRKGGLDPGVGIDLTYFVDSTGFSKPMCPIPGPGPVWMHWLVNITDQQGAEHLIGSYTRVKSLGEAYERGIALYDDSAKIFRPIAQFDLDNPFFPDGHPFRATVDGEEYLYFSFSTPYSMRVRADLAHIVNPASYEAYTCLEQGSRYDKTTPKLDRRPGVGLVYSWKANTDPIDYRQQEELIETGKITPEEAWIHLQDIEAGTSVEPKAGSVFWNEFRKRWIMIFHESGGTSNLGEVWYAEGDTPTGPWLYARKIVTHDKYSFYNVGQHPIFDQEGGRVVYFEGTYTTLFSNSPSATPRYDYNQIMYRLDLSDPRLCLPVPIYLTKLKGQPGYHPREWIDSLNAWNDIDEIPFFAISPNAATESLVAVYQHTENKKARLSTHSKSGTKPVFYGLPLFETKEEMLVGQWKCNAGGFPVQLEITRRGNELKASFKEASLVITKIGFANDTLVFNIKNTVDNEEYIITTSISDGKMIGSIASIDKKETMPWEGERMDALWKLSLSPAVVPLYEFQNSTGEYYYSTDSELPNMKRALKPICKVWRNPSTTMTLDFKAKPIPVLK